MDAQTLNVALDMALEFGPNWLKPTQERLRERFPAFSQAEADEYDRQCRRIMDVGHALGADVYSGKFTGGEAAIRLLSQYPQVDERNASHLLSQGQYYAMKNGVVAGEAARRP